MKISTLFGRRRAGATLIETVVLVSLTSLILTIMSLLTHTLLKSSRQVADWGQARRTLARLEDQIALDSRIAPSNDATIDRDSFSWKFALPAGTRAEYVGRDRSIDRLVLDANGQVILRDQYRLPPSYRFLATQSESTADSLELQVQRTHSIQRTGEQLFASLGLRIRIVANNHSTQPQEAQP
jgi:hypothetical protein